MRQIKFRAWDKISKILLTVINIDFRKDRVKMCTPDLPSNEWNNQLNMVDLMQSTGLLDKNGKEIYEGDVIINPADPENKKWEVVFVTGKSKLGEHDDEWGLGIGFYRRISDAENCEGEPKCSHDVFELLTSDFPARILGNVYENPDLLK